jgi:putative hydrolase of the HAD superfamily
VGDRAGLIVDYGGVLTTDVFASFREFCEAEGLAADTVRDAFRDDPASRQLLADLETGRVPPSAFEPRFAEILGVAPDGLIDRIFGYMRIDQAMLDGVRAAKAAGKRTGLLSNSWGDDRYEHDLIDELFDAQVISSAVGLRKPDPAIYALAAEGIGLSPEACVFVDDLPGNLKPARAIGMATVVHRGDAAATLAEVEEHLGVSLTPR